MHNPTSEHHFEWAILEALTGIGKAEAEALAQLGVAEPITTYAEDSPTEGSPAPGSSGMGWQLGNTGHFNQQYAMDEHFLWAFLQNTQATELKKLQAAPDWQQKILQRLDRVVKTESVLKVLREGLKVDDAHLTLLYPHPLPNSGPAIRERFAANRFSVMRQVPCHSKAKGNGFIDLVLFVNGLAIATIELKTAFKGQNARFHGQKQYRERDPGVPIFQYGRCLVHFAVDTEEVFMATKLNGSSTYFLPFNKGNAHGAGNPPNPFGHRTEYLWKEVFAISSMANLIQHFIMLDKPGKPIAQRTLFFPRYHQMEVVRRIIQDAANKGVGQTYLVQHSAGSGKSYSITWCAFQLIETYPAHAGLPGNKGTELPLFDTVLVVTDRRVLNSQLKEDIRSFSQQKNIVANIDSSQALKKAIQEGKRIVVTTIQKFPYIADTIEDMSDRNFAVIIDEAHSSQSGTAHDNMNRALGNAKASPSEEEVDAVSLQEQVLEIIRNRRMRQNASYLAFTATPKNITLEKFGVRQEDGSYRPFHLYSMKQAIEEGFILDVLANYTTYKSYFEIQKSIRENPLFDSKRAQKKLRAYVEQNPRTIETKAELMVEHFYETVVKHKKLQGQGKGMVVTQNIESAIRYYWAIRRILAEKQAPFRAIVAFSGEKELDGQRYTEASLNGFADDKVKEAFDTDAYRLLVVANKYLTGFDQPKLTAMYVDKKLQGVLAVQALSRLNRSAPKLGKRTEDLFILDFYNTTEDIKDAFDDFYTSTTLSGATDINVLHDLKDKLDQVGVYEWPEVEAFFELYFGGKDGEAISGFMGIPAERFNTTLELEDDAKADFKIKAKQFVKIYGQVAAILPFEQADWEQLYWYLKHLIPLLKVNSPEIDSLDELLNAIDLSTYGLQRTKLNEAIALDDDETQLPPPNPNPRGVHGPDDDKNPLDEIIFEFNQRWFNGWTATPEEQKVKVLNIADTIRNNESYKKHVLNNPDAQNSELALTTLIDKMVSLKRSQELEMYRLYIQDDTFKHSFRDLIRHALLGKGGATGV